MRPMYYSQTNEPSNYAIMFNCRQFTKISRCLGKYGLTNSCEDDEKYKPLYSFAGIKIPHHRTVTENKLIPQLGTAIFELLVQYENLFRYFPDIEEIKKDLNFDFLSGQLDSKSLIYAKSRIEFNRRVFNLDEQNFPKNGDYYNDFMLSAIYSTLPIRYFIFLDSLKYIDQLPNRKIISVWNNNSTSSSEHFKVFSARDSFNIREFFQRRNLLLTCF